MFSRNFFLEVLVGLKTFRNFKLSIPSFIERDSQIGWERGPLIAVPIFDQLPVLLSTSVPGTAAASAALYCSTRY